MLGILWGHILSLVIFVVIFYSDDNWLLGIHYSSSFCNLAAVSFHTLYTSFSVLSAIGFPTFSYILHFLCGYRKANSKTPSKSFYHNTEHLSKCKLSRPCARPWASQREGHMRSWAFCRLTFWIRLKKKRAKRKEGRKRKNKRKKNYTLRPNPAWHL